MKTAQEAGITSERNLQYAARAIEASPLPTQEERDEMNRRLFAPAV